MVNKIYVKTGEYVEAGDDLIKLASKIHSTDYAELTDQRKTLTEQMNKLFGIYESGSICADASGIISGLDEDLPVEDESKEAISLNSSLSAAGVVTHTAAVSLFSDVYDLFLSAAPKKEEAAKPAKNAESAESKETKTKTDKTDTTENKDTKDGKSSKKTEGNPDQTKPSGKDNVNVTDPSDRNRNVQTGQSDNSSRSNVSIPDSAKTQAAGSSTTEGEVQVIGLKKKGLTTIKIAKKVTINGVTYKVTSIGNNAFKNNKKIKKAYIGDNVKTIGKNAFFGCKKLKNLVVKTKVLKKIGKNAFYRKGGKKLTIKVPGAKKKAYKKLFKIAKTNKYKIK